MDHYNTAILCKTASDINVSLRSPLNMRSNGFTHKFAASIVYAGDRSNLMAVCVSDGLVYNHRRRESGPLKATLTTNRISLHRQEEVK
ncbi:hypothetical protein GDO81_006688 [Engystomops pustulosus]|uniref:Uncharacterized protein n=1 Tax=Engystomops pustulosus TaxID=76066 RepID=A0AAV7CYR7_ENGPU|nr:hypothetical protein GDO81_006688 [Engystomops pustulosus]